MRRHNLLVKALQVVIVACVPVMWFTQNPLQLTAAIVAPIAGALWIVAIRRERQSP